MPGLLPAGAPPLSVVAVTTPGVPSRAGMGYGRRMRVIAGGAATYRVQLHAGFTFDAAAALAGYLADLGITHLYCSPSLQAEAGSTHGYDVVDPGRLSHEL